MIKKLAFVAWVLPLLFGNSISAQNMPSELNIIFGLRDEVNDDFNTHVFEITRDAWVGKLVATSLLTQLEQDIKTGNTADYVLWSPSLKGVPFSAPFFYSQLTDSIYMEDYENDEVVLLLAVEKTEIKDLSVSLILNMGYSVITKKWVNRLMGIQFTKTNSEGITIHVAYKKLQEGKNIPTDKFLETHSHQYLPKLFQQVDYNFRVTLPINIDAPVEGNNRPFGYSQKRMYASVCGPYFEQHPLPQNVFSTDQESFPKDSVMTQIVQIDMEDDFGDFVVIEEEIDNLPIEFSMVFTLTLDLEKELRIKKLTPSGFGVPSWDYDGQYEIYYFEKTPTQ